MLNFWNLILFKFKLKYVLIIYLYKFYKAWATTASFCEDYHVLKENFALFL